MKIINKTQDDYIANLDNISKIINDIPGWFCENDRFLFNLLLSFQNVAKIPGNILEVGVYYGQCFAYMQNFLKDNEKLIGLDINPYFYKIQEKYNLYNNIDFRLENSNKLLDLNINNIRFCHIDASHIFDDVYRDIKTVYKIINSYGGIIVLDDFSGVNYLNSIITAYYKAIFDDKLNLRAFLISDNKIYLLNVTNANIYYNHLKNNIVQYIPKELENKIYIKSCIGNSVHNQPVISCSMCPNGLDTETQIPIYNYHLS